MQRDDAEDEAQGQNEHDDRVDLQAGGLVRIQLCTSPRLAHVSLPPPLPVRALLPAIIFASISVDVSTYSA